MRKNQAVVVLLTLVTTMGVLRFAATRWDKPERIQYLSYAGTNPTPVSIDFGAPTSDYTKSRETRVAQKIHTGELLSLEGVLAAPPDGLKPILVEFLSDSATGKPAIANSVVEFPEGDLGSFKVRINAPKTPGSYRMTIQWLGGQFVAQAPLTVSE